MHVNRSASGRRVPAPFRLFRVDDRLLHGQVSLGWGRHLGRTDYVLADKALAGDPDAAELYGLVAPEGSRVAVLSPEGLIAALGRGGRDRGDAGPPGCRESPTGGAEFRHGGMLLDPTATVLLVRRLEQAAVLLRAGVPGPVNLGGMHMRSGAREILPFLFLTPGDRDLLRRLISEGHSFFAQEIPGYPRLDGPELLGHAAWGGES